MRILIFLTALVVSACHVAAQNSVDVWLGTSGHPLSKGIYHTTLNTETGQLGASRLVAEVRGPGFLAKHPQLSCLYAVGTLNSEPSLIAYQIESGTTGPGLVLLNSTAIGDGGAAHLAVDATGSMIVTAQYGGGSVGVFSLNDDGSIRQRTQLIEHTGGSQVRPNQKSPHPHWAGFSPDNRFAFIPDLGKDEVVIYAVDTASVSLTAHGSGTLPPGAGPRHMKFHPNGHIAYVLNENDVSVTVFDYDAESGMMTPKQTIPAVPKEQLFREQTFSASEIRVHPNGRFVYSANRGHDTVTAFRVDPDSGTLTVVEREHVRGGRPRNFNLDPSGRWLLAGGQDSHTLASFAVDTDTGELMYNHSVIHTPSPICVLFD